MSAPAAAPPTEAAPPVSLRTLLGLAWPIVIQRSSQVVIGVCDAVMVAGLGQSALAAVTTGALNTFMLLILPMGVSFIVSSFSSQLFGKGDIAGARRYGFYGLAVALAAGILCLLGAQAVPWALGKLGYAPDVRQLMDEYLRIRLLSGGAAIGMEALSNYYGGLGNTRLPMVASIVAMVLNIVGNYMLIGGHWGAPALGTGGAAWASTLSTAGGFLFLLGKFLWDGRQAGVVLPALRGRELLRMLRFGLPSGFNWFFEFAAFSFFINVVVAGLGTTALAAFMVVMQINSVSFMPAFGLATAGSILVGQAIGAGDKDRVPSIVRLTFLSAGAWQGLVGLVYLCFPGPLFAAFGSGDADSARLLEIGARMLVLSAAWQLFDSAASTLAEALRAAGDTAYTLWTRIALAWGVFAPGAYFTVRHLGWGERGAVVWMVAYLALFALVLYLRFRGGGWRRIELVRAPELALD